jgi:peroxiredoxin Q/BCP
VALAISAARADAITATDLGSTIMRIALMIRQRMFRLTLSCVVVATLGVVSARADESGDKEPPKIGDVIPDFEFRTFDGKGVKLADLASKGPTVLVLLRGYPGYQCPVCTKQVADLRKYADDFKQLGATVLLVYPGAEEKLTERAKEFLKDSKLPVPLILVTDPDYKFIELLGLRWNKPGETAYPSTFVVDARQKVHFGKVSHSHGDRAKTGDVLAVLRAMQAAGSKGVEIPQKR